MNYSDMSDFEINKAVLGKISKFPVHQTPKGNSSAAGTYIAEHSILHWYDFCNNWADAGPIIQDKKISLIFGFGHWDAMSDDGESLQAEEVNPLRAAMIVFMMMKEV